MRLTDVIEDQLGRWVMEQRERDRVETQALHRSKSIRAASRPDCAVCGAESVVELGSYKVSVAPFAVCADCVGAAWGRIWGRQPEPRSAVFVPAEVSDQLVTLTRDNVTLRKQRDEARQLVREWYSGQGYRNTHKTADAIARWDAEVPGA